MNPPIQAIDIRCRQRLVQATYRETESLAFESDERLFAVKIPLEGGFAEATADEASEVRAWTMQRSGERGAH
jgi:hypothetical protein